MEALGWVRGRIDNYGRVLIPRRLRGGFAKDILITRTEDEIRIRRRTHGSFRKWMGKLKIDVGDVKSIDDVIAEDAEQEAFGGD
ncbi:MAG: hypothetical protein V1835_06575 [Candidatus Micrarchaeota archaeon]